MPIRPAASPSSSTVVFAGPALIGPTANGQLLVALLCARLCVLECENNLLHRRVRDLTIACDDLLDAASVHTLCEHEERIIGLVRYYNRPPR